jgi:membrane protease YdiL (CAAX protease family)
MENPVQVPRIRLSLLLWVVGMVGVVAITVTLLPNLLAGEVLPMPVWALTLLSLGQSAAILALVVWAGVALAPVVGLDAPVFVAAITRRPLGPVLRPQLMPGLIAGLLGGAFLSGAWRYAPAILTPIQERLSLPLFARVLYGGITEELLLRWGLMTVLVWLAWTLLQRRRGVPAPGHIWLAIVVSALLFGVGHLPAASVLAGPLESAAVAWVVSVNTAFGLLFGHLFWKHGLESAMIAHGLTHVVHYLAELL